MKTQLTHRSAPKEPEIAAPSSTGPAALIARRASDRIRAGHVWVYRSDVEKLIPALDAEPMDNLPAGALVTVLDNRGIPIGSAIYSSASQIALRLVSKMPALPRTAFMSLIRERVAAALALRKQMLASASDTDSCRLIFSEADALPGIIADKYGDLVILQLLAQGTAQEDVRSAVVEAIREQLAPNTIVERPDPRIRELEELTAPATAPLYAADAAAPLLSTHFTLNGLRFHYDANSGQKTGAFLDQRENYAAAARHAHGEALDICTYQGGFALHLARVCARVTGVDVSRAALETAEKNLQLNRSQLVNAGEGVDWMEANAFDLLRDYEATGQQYDTIVLDPPAFAKTKRAAEGALRGYKEMNLRALKMLRPGGTLVTCSCSHHVSLAEFTEVVAAAASDAQRRVQLLETRGAAPDHPAILTLPETSYLKCLICRVE
ncbi:MAG: class I SAM-dependent rRNA methyltransferase [Acidobacteriaceae bacterium]